MPAAAAPPDLVVTGARLLGSDADAVAVRGRRIAATGAATAMLASCGPTTRVVRLPPGSLLCPGFHDAHLHLHAMAAARSEVSAAGLDLEGLAALVERAVRGRDRASWLVVAEVADDLIVRPGTRDALDRAAGPAPVLLRAHDHHTCMASAAGLAMLGEDTAPGGLLRETAAFRAMEASRAAAPAERLRDLERVLAGLARAGLTAVHEMSGSAEIGPLVELAAADRLPLDVFATLSPGASAPSVPAGGRLHVAGVKAFLDGALGSRTAALLEPYEDAAHAGMPLLTAAEARDVVRDAAARGLPSFLHAIGDRAVRTALDALEGVTGPDGRALRHRVEHAQTVHPEDVGRFAAAGVVASVQPSHIASDASGALQRLGARSGLAFPLRALADAGAVLAIGTDAPIEAPDPLPGLRCAVRRVGRDGAALHPEQALTAAEALAAVTHGAAYAVGRERDLGAIVPGARACLTALSCDVVRRPGALDDARIVLTVSDGAVYGEAS